MDNMEEKKENLIQVDLREIMETSFLDYSMSVIVQRALPGRARRLKPVHRRILYTMYENALWPEKGLQKVRGYRRFRTGPLPSARRCFGL